MYDAHLRTDTYLLVPSAVGKASEVGRMDSTRQVSVSTDRGAQLRPDSILTP